MVNETRIAIATPTYNEAQNIPKLIKRIVKAGQAMPDVAFTILVIDDNSPDSTADIAANEAKQLKRTNVSVQVLRRKAKEGFGKAYVHGFQELLKQPFDYIIQMDADLSHDPKYLKDFVSAAHNGHDFVVASRYMPGGGTPDWNWYRKVLSRSGNWYSRMFLDKRITDYTGGYNMYSSSLLKHIDIKTLKAGGYGFLIELKYRALQKARSPQQISIVFYDRQHGKSKIPKSTLVKNFLLVPAIRYTKHKS